MAELSASMEKSQAEADMFRAKAAQAEAQELALATKIRALEEEIEVAGKEIAEVEAEASAALRVGGEERCACLL